MGSVRGHWVTIYSQTYGYELMWWNHRYVFMSTHFTPPLIFLQVYSAHSDFLNNTLWGTDPYYAIFGLPADNGVSVVPLPNGYSMEYPLPIVSSW